MKNVLIFYLLFISSLRLNAQDIRSSDSVSIDSNILEPIEKPVFVIVRKNMFVSLPTYLGGRSTTGWAALGIYVNKKKKIVNFAIYRIVLNKENHSIIDYQTDEILDVSMYPKKIRPYYDFLLKYVQNLKIIEKSKPNKLNKIEFMVRFKYI